MILLCRNFKSLKIANFTINNSNSSVDLMSTSSIEKVMIDGLNANYTNSTSSELIYLLNMHRLLQTGDQLYSLNNLRLNYTKDLALYKLSSISDMTSLVPLEVTMTNSTIRRANISEYQHFITTSENLFYSYLNLTFSNLSMIYNTLPRSYVFALNHNSYNVTLNNILYAWNNKGGLLVSQPSNIISAVN